MTDNREPSSAAAAAARDGEVALPFDPSVGPGDAPVVFIGHLETPWRTRADCPRNLRQARERGGGAVIELAPDWRAGLKDIEAHTHIVVLYWMDEARRDLIVQTPRHRETPAGVFAIRSPVRPNPIGLAVVRLLAVDHATGRLAIDAIDARSGTPVIDIKPWLQGVDIPPSEGMGPTATG